VSSRFWKRHSERRTPKWPTRHAATERPSIPPATHGKLPVLESKEEGRRWRRWYANIRSIAGVKSTPKSTKGSAKKRAAIAKRTTEDVEDEAGATPTKKPRKSPAKKKVVASPNDEEERLAKESWLRRIKVCCACFVSVCIEEVVL
jgi:hypothetical protein